MKILYFLFNILCVVYASEVVDYFKRNPVCDVSEEQFSVYVKCLENDSDYQLDISLRSKCNAQSGRGKNYGIEPINYTTYQQSCKIEECSKKVRKSKQYKEMEPKSYVIYTEEQKCFKNITNITIVGFFHPLCNTTEYAYNEYLICMEPGLQSYRELYQKCYEDVGSSYSNFILSYQQFQKSCKYRVCHDNLINTNEYKQLKIYDYFNNTFVSKCEQKVLASLDSKK